ncbi:DUF1501 domain-containing protein [Piscinibacter gummiphilus]|uniref:DUF1501 domain-containing protein n=1 Tax=Piscinibacter gummiphilus TaxID=946333 RepID=UPI001F2E7F07|nr:DUF1501 domain-containing protein [Piscinibacter gummiphilus]GLS93743.1 hypothetical protein GCM10007918_10340 [Piscinibacter gummiphilus]
MKLHRRHLLSLAACAGLPGWARAASVVDRVLVLVELKGGNDGLNTVVPYADPAYAALRPTLALKPDVVLPLDEKVGLHPALAPLMPLWAQGELAVLQGLGYPSPNLSHFRSIEIWDSASASDEYLDDGWVARAMAAGLRDRAHFTTEGVALGSAGPGALRGARAVAIGNVDAFVAQSRLVRSVDGGGSPALAHVLRVESDVMKAADGLRTPPATPLATEFPAGAFGQAVRATCRIVAGQAGQGGVPVFHLSLGSFDTHQQQAGTHAGLLKQLAEGLVALRAGLVEAGAWDRTLVLTYSEFGRRARENQSRGTDHGTASSHFALGGAVKGGLIGTMPELERLDATQNLVHTSDFRQVYATIARQWWGVPPEKVIRGRFDPLPFLRA